VLAGGIMSTLVEVFKTGHRDDLISKVPLVFDPILKGTSSNKFMAKSSNLKKARVNLAQRIGCIYLKPKVASWRY
jgi:tubulin-specific chaperone D